MIDQVPVAGGSYKIFEGAGTIVNLPPERLKAFSRPVKTGGLGESLHREKRRAEIGGKWFEEEMQLDIWGLGGESLRSWEILMISGDISTDLHETSLLRR
jgi:hypothetical protein